MSFLGPTNPPTGLTHDVAEQQQRSESEKAERYAQTHSKRDGRKAFARRVERVKSLLSRHSS